MSNKKFDCIVIGGGHAGVEAALASSRTGCKTAMITLYTNTIGQMSCNPAVGGVGKGQLVKEIDALGGEMGLAADITGIQFRQLNASKGQAVRSSRCQSDRKLYKEYMQKVVLNQDNLSVIEGQVSELLVSNNKIKGVKILSGDTFETRTVVVAAGTFLSGRIHIGNKIISGGRIDEPAAIKLTDSIKNLGFPVLFFKTGTPPRLDGKTINFNDLEIQHSDEKPIPFSFRTQYIPEDQKLLPCYITNTNKTTHDIIRENMHLSPMYSGQIDATGVRYCPSIEDKLKKFGDKSSHHVFLEPEGLDTDEYYPNGISTGLPENVQDAFVHSIKGLENVKIVRPGYSIEHGVIPPTELTAYLETKKVKGLFFAGQINGTTGYEEAAAQGLMAGINAALKVKDKEPFILGRQESYIGVLLDDLVTKGTNEPYRMFTSRVEYRLIVREDNADYRMAEFGYKLGLLNEDAYNNVKKKYDLINNEISRLQSNRILPSSPKGVYLNDVLRKNNSSPIKRPTTLSVVLKRPEIRYEVISGVINKIDNTESDDISDKIIEQVEYEIKYEGFIQRQLKDIDKFKHIENIKIPEDIKYDNIPGLSIEIQQKLKQHSPLNLGQAHRIPGVTPASISILMIYLKKIALERKE